MKNEDKKRFLEQLNGVAICYGKELESALLNIFWECLKDYDIDAVCMAFQKHMRESVYFPKPSEIINRISTAPKHIGANEAWAIALKSMDERETVVWTEEIAKARAIAWDVWITGDSIGARMTFIETYNRLIANANTPKWSACLGDDASRLAPAITKAIDQGLLPKGSERKYLEHGSRDAGAIAGLLTGNVVEMPKNNEVLKSRWHELSAALNEGRRKAEESKQREAIERQEKRIEFEKMREAALDAIHA